MKVDLTFKSLSNPLLFIGDAPDLLGGLSRIGRDLASLCCTMPQFRVGYLGRGGIGDSRFPWTSYSFPESAQWGEDYIERVWNNFSRGEPGIIFSTWDVSRMLWFAQPGTLAQARPDLARFLGEGCNFKKWGYFPVDGAGPDGYRLGLESQAVIAGYDRILAASEWGAGVLRESGRRDADWIPHGIYTDTFRPEWPEMKATMVLGCVMANQSRKDWPIAFHCAAMLKKKFGNTFRLWVHTDKPMDGYWNIYALASDYDIRDCLALTTVMLDVELAAAYARCCATILPSGGEGFGYPIAESMACGTPCVVPDHSAAQELVEPDCRVSQHIFRIDTRHNVRRAVLEPAGFAALAATQMERKRDLWEKTTQECRARVEHLDWDKLQHVWKRWLLEGLK